MYSPLMIKIIIHYHCTLEPGGDYCDSLDFKNIAKELFDRGILVAGKSRLYSANVDATQVYIDKLCSVSLPEKKWIIEQ